MWKLNIIVLIFILGFVPTARQVSGKTNKEKIYRTDQDLTDKSDNPVLPGRRLVNFRRCMKTERFQKLLKPYYLLGILFNEKRNRFWHRGATKFKALTLSSEKEFIENRVDFKKKTKKAIFTFNITIPYAKVAAEVVTSDKSLSREKTFYFEADLVPMVTEVNVFIETTERNKKLGKIHCSIPPEKIRTEIYNARHTSPPDSEKSKSTMKAELLKFQKLMKNRLAYMMTSVCESLMNSQVFNSNDCNYQYSQFPHLLDGLEYVKSYDD